MHSRIGFILLALVGAVGVVWMLSPLTLIVPIWLTVFWLFCPEYNALSTSCGTAGAEFIMTRLAAAGAVAVLACLLVWLLARWWNRP